MVISIRKSTNSGIWHFSSFFIRNTTFSLKWIKSTKKGWQILPTIAKSNQNWGQDAFSKNTLPMILSLLILPFWYWKSIVLFAYQKMISSTIFAWKVVNWSKIDGSKDIQWLVDTIFNAPKRLLDWPAKIRSKQTATLISLYKK